MNLKCKYCNLSDEEFYKNPLTYCKNNPTGFHTFVKENERKDFIIYNLIGIALGILFILLMIELGVVEWLIQDMNKGHGKI